MKMTGIRILCGAAILFTAGVWLEADLGGALIAGGLSAAFIAFCIALRDGA
jgi:hypothetical protein